MKKRINKKGAAWPMELLVVILFIIIALVVATVAFNFHWKDLITKFKILSSGVSEDTLKVLSKNQREALLTEQPEEIERTYVPMVKGEFEDAGSDIDQLNNFIREYCGGKYDKEHGLCDDAYYKLGDLYEQENKIQNALESYKKALTYDFNVPNIPRKIIEDKIKELEKEISGTPAGEIPGAKRDVYQAGISYFYDGFYDKAMEIFDPISKNSEVDSSLRTASKYWIARIYLEKGQEKNTFNIFNEIKEKYQTERFPPSAGMSGGRDGLVVAWVYYELGKYYDKKKDYTNAYANYNKVLIDYSNQQVTGKIGSYVIDQIKTDFDPKCNQIKSISACNEQNKWIDEEKIAQNDPELVYSLKCWSKDESERFGRMEIGGKRVFEGTYSCNPCSNVEPKICEGYERSHDTCELDPCHFVDGTTKKCGWSVSLGGRYVRQGSFDVGTCATMTKTQGVWEFLREGWWKE